MWIMKKNGFLEGALIATIGIVLCKIIGLFYVIPFYAIIGTQGGALYSYAYSIYAIFLSLSISGIPVAISKVISEYNALGYHYTKERAFKIGSYLITGLGVFFFIVLILFAPMIADTILGSAIGGNTKEGITLVIRIVATALLIVPIESVTQGYLQGQKFIAISSVANVIEQLVRVTIIIVGSFTALRVFHLSLETAVGISVFAATLGCLAAYFYLFLKIQKNRQKLKRDLSPCMAERKIRSRSILKKIVFYALPFVLIDVLNSAYGMVDTLTVVNTMSKLGYSTAVAEKAIGVLTTWGTKLNTIVAAIAIGVSTSLIPNIASANVKKDFKDLNRKVNQSLQALIVTTLPMVSGLFFLATPVWVIFYGYDAMSIDIFKWFIIPSITFSFFTILIDIMQTLNESKITLGTLFGSFLAKAIMNIPLMMLFVKIGIEAFYAPIFATFLTQGVSSLFLLFKLKKKYHVHYFKTFKIGMKTILCVGIMMLFLGILSFFIPVTTTTRFASILIAILYSILGMMIYFLCTLKSGVLYEVFGKETIKNIWNHFLPKKRADRK